MLTLVVLALTGCGRRGSLEAPPGGEAIGPEELSPPAPGSGGPTGPRPFAGPGSNPLAKPATAVVGEPVTNKRPARPKTPFFLDPIL